MEVDECAVAIHLLVEVREREREYRHGIRSVCCIKRKSQHHTQIFAGRRWQRLCVGVRVPVVTPTIHDSRLLLVPIWQIKEGPVDMVLPQITPNTYGSGFYLNANDRSSSTRVRIYTENINGGPLDGGTRFSARYCYRTWTGPCVNPLSPRSTKTYSSILYIYTLLW